MGDTKDRLLSLKKELESLISSEDNIYDAAPDLLQSLDSLSVDLEMLKKTKIAFTVDKLRKSCDDTNVKKSAKSLLKKWATLEAKDSKPKQSKSKSDTRELDFELTATEPSRNKKNQLVFDDSPDFKPNLSPKDVLQLGSFGGTYFRPIYSSVTKKKYGSEVWKELPADWLQGLDVKRQVASSVYDTSVNKYKVKCGASLEEWESSGWMREQDPYGWFQWYCRFYQGRRTEDDERQISRWMKCCGPKGRWKNNLISKIAKAGCGYDNFGVSPVVRQTLQHWGYVLTKEDYDKEKKRFQ